MQSAICTVNVRIAFALAIMVFCPPIWGQFAQEPMSFCPFTGQNDKWRVPYHRVAKCTFTVQNALYHPDGKMYVLMYC